MCYLLIAFLLLVGIISVKAQCPPDQMDMYQVVRILDRQLDKIQHLKPGTDPKDADWVVNRIAKDITTGKKFSPCNDGFRWEDMQKDVKEIRGDCYKPADYTTPPVQKAFVNCAKKYLPQLIVKYGTPALNACSCFSSTIIPNWDTKYKKYVIAYVDEFRTLKHRKK